MSISLRIVLFLCCAYAGWQTASAQSAGVSASAATYSAGPRMNKPQLHVEGPQPRQVQRADIPPATCFAIVIDGHFKTEFVDKEAAMKAAARVAGQVSDAAGRDLRRIIEVTVDSNVTHCRIAAALITTFPAFIYL